MLAWLFVSLKYLLDRLCGARARADELYALRRRLNAKERPAVAGDAETQLALRLLQLRQELLARIGPVESCAHCAQSQSATWPGGFCCSGHTEALFTDHELAALKLAGTTAATLSPPRANQAGCVFRGPKGCSLKVAHRPCLCVRFVCSELRSELDRRGDCAAIVRLQGELKLAFDSFVQQRDQRIESTSFALLEASLRGPPDSR
jgi:hypothetical protein